MSKLKPVGGGSFATLTRETGRLKKQPSVWP